MTATAVHKAASVGRHMFKLHKPKAPAPAEQQQQQQQQPHSEPATLEAADQRRDREFIANALDQNGVKALAPDEVAQDPEKKALGKTSKALQKDDFEMIRTLGTGTFARVWLARLSSSDEELKEKVFALKVLRKADVIRLKQVEHILNERAVLAAVAGHPFIVTLITTFSDHDSLYMLLDYCPGGEVFTYLRRARRFDLDTARFYAAEIFLILEFLHEVEHVAYRDLKPENLLLDAEGHIKLVDFGFAKNVAHGATFTLCGTPEYLAPEVIQSQGHSTAVDWWAFGILIYEFLVGQPPFWDENPIKIYEKILHHPIRFPRDMPADAKDLIQGLCTVERSRRLGNLSSGAADIKNHAFFAPAIDWAALYNRKKPGPIVPRLEHAADASNFDEYPDEDAAVRHPYTDELRAKYEDVFRDF